MNKDCGRSIAHMHIALHTHMPVARKWLFACVLPPFLHGLVLVQFVLDAFAVLDFFELKADADKQQRALRGLPSAIMCADSAD